MDIYLFDPVTAVFFTNKGDKVLIDPEDAEMVSKHDWYVWVQKKRLKPYKLVASRIDGKIVCLCHYILSVEPNGKMLVDHINGNTLDNRKSNLRLCTRSQSEQNKPKRVSKCHSVYKGVTFLNDCNRTRPWQVKIKFGDNRQFVGMYKTEKEAADAYNKRATELFGEFANLNSL